MSISDFEKEGKSYLIKRIQSCNKKSHLWEDREREIFEIAEPLVFSDAFQRLGSITFLGILSPRYALQTNSPLFINSKTPLPEDTEIDGCRKSHSIGVASILLDISRRLKMSTESQHYYIAWGLLHDIATWPLSHTGEPAFSTVTGISTKELRAMIILGGKNLPENLHLNNALKKIGVQPEKLLSLFSTSKPNLEKDLNYLYQIIRSPITPDTMEGIWRAGLAFGINVPHPNELQEAIYINLDGICIKKEYSEEILRFWRKKTEIYKKFINQKKIIQWESTWSLGIEHYLALTFKPLDLFTSLSLSEIKIINEVLNLGLPSNFQIKRYKTPLKYFLCQPKKKKIYINESLCDLNELFKKGIELNEK